MLSIQNYCLYAVVLFLIFLSSLSNQRSVPIIYLQGLDHKFRKWPSLLRNHCNITVNVKYINSWNRLVSSVDKGIAVGARGLGCDSRASQIEQCQQLAIAARFLCNCVAQVAKQRRWSLPLVTRFVIILRV